VATCLHELGRPAEAVAYIAASIEEARAQDDRLFEAVGLHNLGFTYLKLEQYDEAVAAFEASVPIARDLGNRYIHADDLNGIALAMHARERMAEAGEFHRQALAVFEDLPEVEAARYLAQLQVSPLRYPP
jgi:tetratricopeptide (TPR) repeat protein